MFSFALDSFVLLCPFSFFVCVVLCVLVCFLCAIISFLLFRFWIFVIVCGFWFVFLVSRFWLFALDRFSFRVEYFWCIVSSFLFVTICLLFVVLFFVSRFLFLIVHVSSFSFLISRCFLLVSDLILVLFVPDFLFLFSCLWLRVSCCSCSSLIPVGFSF